MALPGWGFGPGPSLPPPPMVMVVYVMASPNAFPIIGIDLFIFGVFGDQQITDACF